MNKSQYETIEYFVFFTKTKLDHWIFKFIDSEIQHVYVMKKTGDYWTVVNPLRSHIQTELVPVDECPHPRCFEPDAVILPIRTTINKDSVVYGPGILSCVSIVKSLLGMRKRFILTPYQLYKYLAEKGV